MDERAERGFGGACAGFKSSGSLRDFVNFVIFV